MKKLLLATSAIVALVAVAPAGAADLRVKAPPMVRPIAPACAQFGGFYVGANVGGAYYDHSWHDRDSWAQSNDSELPDSVQARESGFIGGVQGGYNWQPTNCTVFGVEVDYSWASIHNDVHETDGGFDSVTVSSRLRGFGTVRARTGVVVDNLLLYVTGGLAFANFNRSYTLSDFGCCAETFEHSRTRWGWTFGIGTEWAIWNNWSLKSEVLYARFENDERTHTGYDVNPGDSFRFDHHDSVWVTRIGLNYRFGGVGKAPFGKGPVVARY